mgnify:CR=1 FL=1
MNLLVFSDIHGNSYALDALLQKMSSLKYDKIIFCGDIFGYYYNQKDVIQKLIGLENLIWLKGNHDEYFLNLYSNSNIKEPFIENYGHSYDNLNVNYDISDIDIISNLPSHYVLTDTDCKIGIFHGTPDTPLEGRLYPNTIIENPSVYQDYDIVILGHTHCRMARLEGSTLIVNPGSLGQPRDGNGYGYAMIDTTCKSVIFKNVYFDESPLYNQIDKYDTNLTKLKAVLERGTQ